MSDRVVTLPPGVVPRLLTREHAAAYCAVCVRTFDQHVAPNVAPVGIGSTKRWDVKALDRWLDQESGFTPVVRSTGSWADRLAK